MRSSNIYRNGLVLAAAILLSAGTVGAVDPNRNPAQYIREFWGSEEGFPGGSVHAIAQTPDGYLWIGAETGLIRFDGLKFTHLDYPPGPINGLTTDVEGNLWIRLDNPSLLRYRDGNFSDVSGELGNHVITAMGSGCDGQILIEGITNLTFRPHAGKLQGVAFKNARHNVIVTALVEAADGNLWLGTRDNGFLSLAAGQDVSVLHGLEDRRISALLAMGGQELLIGSDDGIARWTGSEITRRGIPESLRHVETRAMVRDREANAWIGTSSGLWRLNARGAVGMPKDGGVNALFEDREGNLWVGSNDGIARLRDGAFLTHLPALTTPPENNGALYADSERRIWFAPSAGGLFWLEDGHVEPVTVAGLKQDVVYSIAGSRGEIWIGRRNGGLTHLVGNRAETYTRAQGLAQDSIYTVYRDRDGTIWAGSLNGGVSSVRSGKVTTYTVADGLASNTVSAIIQTTDGTTWFATSNGLSSSSQGRWHTYTGREGLPPGSVDCLFEDSQGTLWIGASEGIAFFRSGRIEVPRDMPASLHEAVLGISEDRRGWLWIATRSHILRVNRSHLTDGGLSGSDVREFGPSDGLGGHEGVERDRSVVSDSLGRIWFSTNRGIAVVDPTRLEIASAATAIVHIQSLSADNHAIGLVPPVLVPAAPRRITFDYVGLALSAPEKVRYRYRLDGYDHGWSEPTSEREAPYTNLGPATYRFRVIASNAAGLFNGSEAALEFRIAPSFWQTWWFISGVVLTFGLALFAAYRLRLHQLTSELNLRFEERLAERTRIAQDLHDTLLQGLLSASMQLDLAVNNVPAELPAKPALSHVLELMQQVVQEGRNAVRGLRSTSARASDLAESLSRVPQELAIDPSTEFKVIVEGQPTALHPLIRDDVYRIVREALVNAFRHSGAQTVSMELDYTNSQLRVLVHDNGRGIEPEVLQSGREGHWGLSGMRERTERIGGQLKLWSGPAAGTEIELVVPGPIAFVGAKSDEDPRT